jgi:SAM-dependent methyltransferase
MLVNEPWPELHGPAGRGYNPSMSVVEYYSSYDEEARLSGEHSLERVRSREIIGRSLPAHRISIIDIGGAAGAYSFWLAGLGHEVSLVDLTPKHVEQARRTNEGSPAKLARIQVGDALGLEFEDAAFDLALLMGPLYHLPERGLRIRAIREAARVVKPGGIVVAAAISRFAALLDGYKYGHVADPAFRRILDRGLATGNHVNDSGNPEYFTTASFHRASELGEELAEAGLSVEGLLAVEGFAHLIPGVEDKMRDPEYRGYLLEKLRETEAEASLVGASSHLLAIARKA